MAEPEASLPPDVERAGRRSADAGVFVGREAELTALRAAVEDACAGRGQLVLLAGEPGIGKTRTAQEVATTAGQRGMQVLWGRCYEGDGAPAYWPWVQILRACAHGCDAETLAAEMGPGAVDITQIVPEIRDRLPSLPSPATMDPAQARFRLFDSVTTFLKKVADRQPLALVLDDLHWADTPSLLLLLFLAHAMESARLLVLGTYRDVEVEPQQPLFQTLGDLARQQLTRRLVLSGLTEHDLATYIEMTAGIAPAAGLVAEIAHETEGNPFFVAEVVRLLIAEGGVEGLRSETRSTRAIPQGVREVIGRRLDRLSSPCNDMLRVAAVIGREFGLKVLEVASDRSRDRLVEALEEAVRARIIFEVRGTLGRYRFSHALVRETLYDALIVTERIQLHQRVGEALEGVHAAHLEPYLAELAHHFLQAAAGGAAQKAVDYARRAGDRANAQLAFEVAARHYEQALQALDLTDAPDAMQRCDLLLALGDASFGVGETVQSHAKHAYFEAAALARQAGDAQRLARAAIAQVVFRAWKDLGRLDEDTLVLLEDALLALGPEDSVLRAKTLAALTRLLVPSGAFAAAARADALSREAVDIARRIGDREALALALFARCVALAGPDHLAERRAITTEWLQLATAAGAIRSDVDAYSWGAFIDAYSSRITASLEVGDRAELEQSIDAYARLADELRVPWYKAVALSHQALRAQMAGRLDEEERLAEQLRAIGREVSGRAGMLKYMGHLAVLRWEQGRAAELEAGTRAGVARYPTAPGFRIWLALICSETGRLEEARQEFERLAANAFTCIPRDGTFLANAALLAVVCAALTDRTRAVVLSELLLPYAERCAVIEGPVWLGSVAYYLGLLATTLAHWDDAVQHFEHALEVNTRIGLRPALAHTQYDCARMLLARGDANDRQRAFDLLRKALDTAQELGMKMLLDKVMTLKLNAASPTTVGDIRDARGAPPASTTALLHPEGDYWTLAYDDTHGRLKDSKGLQYLAHLLRHSGQEFHVLDLMGRVSSVGGQGTGNQKRETRDQGLPILDGAAKADYGRRVMELREELAEAEQFNDAGRVERLRAEIEAITEQLASAVGLGGRDRTALSATERARSTVTQRIKTAIKHIRERCPALAAHLADRVKTGTFCVYRPDPGGRLFGTCRIVEPPIGDSVRRAG